MVKGLGLNIQNSRMKNIIPILIFCLVFPAHLLAEPPQPNTDEENTAKVTGIKKGEEAPYNGVLLNTAAAAKIFADKEYSAKECELRINYEVQKEILRMQLLLDTTKVSLEATQTKYDAIVKIKDNELERLSKIALKPKNDYSSLWASGGVLVGIGLTIAVVYAIGELK